MLGTPIAELNFQSVVEFLTAGLREGFILDYKRDFPEHLDRIIAAFANTWGGVVLIGVEETSTGAGKCPPVGVELRPGLRERVLRTALDGIFPPVVPEVHVIPFNSGDSTAVPDRAIVVVRVHESNETPHWVNGRTAIYLRTDNVSTPYLRKATAGELEWLVNKRAKSETERERVLKVVKAHAAVYRDRRTKQRTNSPLLGKGQFAFYTAPHYPRLPLAEPRELMTLAQKNGIQIPAVPHALPSGTPQPVTEGVVFENSYGTTELQQQGMVYHAVDFWWDYPEPEAVTRKARTVLPGVTAAFLWGMSEFAVAVYSALGYAGLIDLEFKIEGVRDACFRGPQDFNIPWHPIVDDVIEVRRTHTVADLRDRRLQIIAECQRELYWSCGINAADSLIKQDFSNCHR